MEQQSGNVHEQTLYSEASGETVSFMIYLPYNYSALYTYPLLIANDGQDYFRLGRIARTADRLISNGDIEPLIIVGVPYKDKYERYEKYHPDGKHHKSYIQFLTNELLPFLERNYATHQLPRGRGLIGDSLAGTVSLMTALSYPYTFGKVIMQSPLVNDDIIDRVNDFPPFASLSLYHVAGKQETEVETTQGGQKNFIEPNRELMNVIQGMNFDYFYDEFDGDHTWTYWQPDLERALSLMFSLE